jgi:hypothetical protein
MKVQLKNTFKEKEMFEERRFTFNAPIDLVINYEG